MGYFPVTPRDKYWDEKYRCTNGFAERNFTANYIYLIASRVFTTSSQSTFLQYSTYNPYRCLLFFFSSLLHTGVASSPLLLHYNFLLFLGTSASKGNYLYFAAAVAVNAVPSFCYGEGGECDRDLHSFGVTA